MSTDTVKTCSMLEQDGVVVFPRVQLTPASNDWWQHCLESMKTCKRKGKAYKTGRIAHRIDTSTAPSSWMEDVFTKDIRSVLREYLNCKSIAVHHCEVIAVPRRSPTQMFHRDHNYGTHICLTLAVCMNPNRVLKTEFVLGTPAAKGNVRADPVAPLGSTTLFEGCILHAGGEETEIKQTDYERLFFTITDSKTAEQYTEDLNFEFPDHPISYETIDLSFD